MNFWGIFGKKQVLPTELCAVTEVDLEWVESQTKLMEKIAQTIEIRQYKTATASITITPVNATRRLRERIEKFGTDNLETNVTTRPIDENTTRMDVNYGIVIGVKGRVYRIESMVYLVARFQGGTIRRQAINLRQHYMNDICNIQMMSYLKMHYPYLYGIFGKSIEVPTYETIERALKSKFRYFSQPMTFQLKGMTATCPHNETHLIPDYTKQTVGDLLGMRKMRTAPLDI